MLSSATISVDDLQARALAADEAAKQEFRNKVLSYANDFRFALKEASRLLGVSAGFLRNYAARNNIEFSDPELRTKEESKSIFKQYEEIRLSKEPKRVEPRKPLLKPDELQLPPQLDLLSKKAHWERQNKFLERVQELAQTMTMKEVSKRVGVSLRFLKNFSYEHDIEFVGSKARPVNEALSPVFIAEEPPCPKLIEFLSRPMPRATDICEDELTESEDVSSAAEVDSHVTVEAVTTRESIECAATTEAKAEAVQHQSVGRNSGSDRYSPKAPASRSDTDLNILTLPHSRADENVATSASIDQVTAAVASPGINGERLPGNLPLPAAFVNQRSQGAAWTAWYGSAKAVASVFEQICKAKISALGDTRMLMRVPPHAALTSLFISPQCFTAIVDAFPADEAANLFPASRLEANLKNVLGAEVGEIRSLSNAGTAGEVARAVESIWPWTSRLHDHGGFSRHNCVTLLTIGALLKAFQRPNLASTDAFRIDMAITTLLSVLPDPLDRLIATSSSRIRQIGYAGLAGVEVTDEAGAEEFWQAVGTETFNACVDEVKRRAPRIESGLTRVSSSELKAFELERTLLAARPDSQVLHEIYSDFVSNTGSPNWNSLLDSLESYSATTEIPLDAKVFARDLFNKPIQKLPSPTLEAVQILRKAICTSVLQEEPLAFRQRAERQMDAVQKVQSQIKDLGDNLTAANMLKLADLAEQGRIQILASREWFESEIKTYAAEVQHWRDFFADWQRLAAPAERPKEKANSKGKEQHVQVAEPVPESEVVKELRSELADAEDRNQHLEQELKEVKSEAHRLRQVADARSLPTQQFAPVIEPSLLRRIGTRKGITPVDVLAYLQVVSGDRVEILESAWKSAKASEKFAYSERMLDLLDTLVNPYFDSLAAGNPDSVSRELLGGAYVAKESDATSNCGKMRAQREFSYQGQRMYFERHLRVGSGIGNQVCMRIYFQIIDSKIVIAYAGEHLEIASTN
ncbi:hypothetical protein ABZQ56_30175 [Pseudomonas aeruginosa]